jgi:crossover junction endodeoxyribonuclease RuvC
MARGVALFVAAEQGIAIHEYTPATVKKAVVGNGNASKEQVAAMVRVILGLAETPKPADAADAIAIALAHAHRGASSAVAVAALRASGPR